MTAEVDKLVKVEKYLNYTLTYNVVLVYSNLELKPVGVLEVKLVQAKDLTNKDVIGKSDPYAKLYIRPLRERTKTSKTIVCFTLHWNLLLTLEMFGYSLAHSS